MSTVRLFLRGNLESKVRLILSQLHIDTIGKEYSSNGSHVVNVFDPPSFEELSKRQFAKTEEEAILIASGDCKYNFILTVQKALKKNNIVLLAILDYSKFAEPSESDALTSFEFLLR